MNSAGVAVSPVGPAPEPLEARDELRIEDAHLAVEDERPGRERAEGGDKLGEALRVILACLIDEPDGRAVLVGHHPTAVILLLVHPALAVEGAGDQRRVHQGHEGESITRVVGV